MKAKHQATKALLVILAMSTMAEGQELPPLSQAEFLNPIQRFDTGEPGGRGALRARLGRGWTNQR